MKRITITVERVLRVAVQRIRSPGPADGDEHLVRRDSPPQTPQKKPKKGEPS